MFRSFIFILLLGLAGLRPAWADAAFRWDGAVGLGHQQNELELGILPSAWQRDAGLLFGPLRLGLGWVPDKADRSSGVRLHLDTFGADRGPYLQAGLILSAGQELGAGAGARFGVGYRFRQPLRVAVLVDGVVGTRKSVGSVGIQAAYTF